MLPNCVDALNNLAQPTPTSVALIHDLGCFFAIRWPNWGKGNSLETLRLRDGLQGKRYQIQNSGIYDISFFIAIRRGCW